VLDLDDTFTELVMVRDEPPTNKKMLVHLGAHSNPSV